MKSAVSGMAGAVRVNQLTVAGLTRQELHGKRLDKSGNARAISEEPPVTTSGLDLTDLFRAHIDGAFVPRAKSKAMHMIVQFPKDLVDGDDALAMLKHARCFANKILGGDAVFADRVDRDEKGRHVVDLFVAPKYLKRTANQEKVAISITRHLKLLAEECGHPPIPMGIGRALQDAWHAYLRDEMKLAGVERGVSKRVPGPDWKSAEQLREEELQTLIEEARVAKSAAWDVGYAAGRANAADKLKSLEEAAKLDREMAKSELAIARSERSAAKQAGLEDALRALDRREAEVRKKESDVGIKLSSAQLVETKALALQAGVKAWANSDIVGIYRSADGKRGVRWRDAETKDRLRHLIVPALKDVCDVVSDLQARAKTRAIALEADATRKVDELLRSVLAKVQTFVSRYNSANRQVQEILENSEMHSIASALVTEPHVKEILENSERDDDRDFLINAATAGLIPYLKPTAKWAGR